MPQLAQRSLASGELSPAAQARSDLAKYLSGLNLCENYYVKAQGGAYNRPGWRFINVLDDSTRKGRLIEFSFNTEQTYMLVFEHLKVRVIRDGGLILAGGGPAIFELVTPYTEDQLPTLGFSQDADVMTLTHKSHDPASLSRIADDNWTLTTNDYSPTVDTPAFNASDTVSSITNITKANPAVVTSPGHGWDEGNLVEVKSVVGMTELNDRLFRVTDIVDGVSYALDGEDSTGYTAYVSGGNAFRSNGATTIGSGFGDFEKTYTYVVTAVDLDGVESLASVPGIITTQSLSTTGAVKLRWDSVSGADYYRVYKDPSVNSQVYGWIGDSKTLYFEDYNVAPLTSDTPPEAREPFAAAGDKPGVSTYYQQRQVFASTSNEPQRSDVTQVGNPSSLRTSHPARAADAFTFTIKAQQVNEIRHLLPLGDLIVLTSGGVWKVTEGADGVLTPATAGVRIQSYVGASKVPPVVVNSTALYVQYAGARVRDLGYEYTSNKYTGNDLSIYAMHLFGGHSIVDMAYAEEPDSILWCVRDDGTLIGLTYQREHQVWGWHRHTTLGEVESAASILEDGRSAVYLIVKRNINGTDVRHIERMEPREETATEDAFFVDSGLTYDGAPATVISGLDHLEGEEVAILSDGYTVPDQVVTSGSITLDVAASKVHVGLRYTPAIETLDIDTPSESVKAQNISVSKVTIELEKSLGGWIGPRKDDGTTGEMYEIKPRDYGDDYDQLALKTYKAEQVVDPLWAKGGGVRIEQRDPLPHAVLSVIPTFDVGG